MEALYNDFHRDHKNIYYSVTSTAIGIIFNECTMPAAVTLWSNAVPMLCLVLHTSMINLKHFHSVSLKLRKMLLDSNIWAATTIVLWWHLLLFLLLLGLTILCLSSTPLESL